MLVYCGFVCLPIKLKLVQCCLGGSLSLCGNWFYFVDCVSRSFLFRFINSKDEAVSKICQSPDYNYRSFKEAGRSLHQILRTSAFRLAHCLLNTVKQVLFCSLNKWPVCTRDFNYSQFWNVPTRYELDHKCIKLFCGIKSKWLRIVLVVQNTIGSIQNIHRTFYFMEKYTPFLKKGRTIFMNQLVSELIPKRKHKIKYQWLHWS